MARANTLWNSCQSIEQQLADKAKDWNYVSALKNAREMLIYISDKFTSEHNPTTMEVSEIVAFIKECAELPLKLSVLCDDLYIVEFDATYAPITNGNALCKCFAVNVNDNLKFVYHNAWDIKKDIQDLSEEIDELMEIATR